ncbi:uncharacterized protein BP5553_09401 [Venustampulla echinocandica]|uniref:Uncharacterized protein n=1 Tax=Venustampulla echinocandica TaxID=2656787 RepID=A0A370TCL8_9HELO|nr:uncharacterized protein BP5553_09401 [Venustampulla echinocandica]RDL31999.1 hypothetical protein BP5553_09401 [Venustampulla echinocandica]
MPATQAIQPTCAPSQSQSFSPSFLGIPRELRNEIYKLLLVDPVLGEYSSVCEYDHFGGRSQYNLHPAILAVSHQIHNESSNILYGHNLFFITLLDDIEWLPSDILLSISPITRYQHHQCGHGEEKALSLRSAVAAISKVKRWRVVLSAGVGNIYWDSGPPTLVSFCRSICRTPLQSLDIAIIPAGMEQEDLEEYYPIMTLLNPFRIIRGVQDFAIRAAIRPESPDVVVDVRCAEDNVGNADNSALKPLAVELSKLQKMVMSNEVVELVFDMYRLLIRYSEGFERHPPFKGDMSLNDFGETTPFRAVEYRRHVAYDSPFHRGPTPKEAADHPVEYNLFLAQLASDINDVPGFKQRRAIVLEYLEPQYQRICKAASNLIGFIKEEKTRGKLFDVNKTSDAILDIESDRPVTAIILLEDYGASFGRDMPRRIRSYIRQKLPKFNELYSGLKSEMLLNEAAKALETEDLSYFVERYQAAVDELNIQYFEIRAARKTLFDCDILGAPGVNLGPEILPFHSDEPIDWSVNEPGLNSAHSSEEQEAVHNDTLEC